jgi:hypothetical protein
MPPWPRGSSQRRVFRLDSVAARRRMTRRAASVATATTSSTANEGRDARAVQPMSAARTHPSVAPASARTARVGRPAAAPPIASARSIRTAARASVDALSSSLVPRVAPAAMPPARRRRLPVPSMRIAALRLVRPVLTRTHRGFVFPPDQAQDRPVRAAANCKRPGVRGRGSSGVGPHPQSLFR